MKADDDSILVSRWQRDDECNWRRREAKKRADRLAKKERPTRRSSIWTDSHCLYVFHLHKGSGLTWSDAIFAKAENLFSLFFSNSVKREMNTDLCSARDTGEPTLPNPEGTSRLDSSRLDLCLPNSTRLCEQCLREHSACADSNRKRCLGRPVGLRCFIITDFPFLCHLRLLERH